MYSHFRIYLLTCIAILGQDIAILGQDSRRGNSRNIRGIVVDKPWNSRGYLLVSCTLKINKQINSTNQITPKKKGFRQNIENPLFELVEDIGFEPMTPCVQGRCSSQLS